MATFEFIGANFRKAAREEHGEKPWGRRRLPLASGTAPTAGLSAADPEDPARGGGAQRGSRLSHSVDAPALRPAPDESSFKLRTGAPLRLRLLAPAPRAARPPYSDWSPSLLFSRDAKDACRGPALFREP